VGVDRETAVLVDLEGHGAIIGKGPVYFLEARERHAAPTPLTTGPIDVYRAFSGGTFDFRSWTGTGGSAYHISAVQGRLTSDQPGGSAY
jgi:cyanophycinase-like exopeptidase